VREYSFATNARFVEALRHFLGLDPLHEGTRRTEVERFAGPTYPD
jgi:hypothetical protein